MRKAILDDDGNLIDFEKKSRLAKDDIDCGDLPTDGSYRFVGGSFVKNTSMIRSKANRDRALYLLIRAAQNGEDVPQECIRYADWYAKHFGE